MNKVFNLLRFSKFTAFALCLSFALSGFAVAQDDSKSEKDDPKVESKEDEDQEDQDEDSKESDDEKDDKKDKPTLTIGSTAPNIEIDDWISDNDGLFDHITEFESGKVYVIQFTSVNAAQGVRLMPMNARLQKKYENGSVQIIAIWAESKRFIEKYLEKDIPNDPKGRTIGDLTNGYCITSDKDRSVATDYFKASGQFVMPLAFIVGKTGKIEWIGPALRMEKPLEEVVDDTWDRKKFLPKYNKELAEMRQLQRDRETIGKIERELLPIMQEGDMEGAAKLIAKEIAKHRDNVPVKMGLEQMREQGIYRPQITQAVASSMRASNYEEVQSKLEKLIADSEDESFKLYGTKILITLLARFRMEDAAASLEKFVEKHKDDSEELNNLSWELYELYESEGLDMDVLEICKKAAERAVKISPEKDYILDTLAHLVYAVDEDLDKAIELQKKAVKLSTNQRPELQEYLDKLIAEKKTGKKKKKPEPKVESDF
ncbi:MAG: hypothetical protein AB8B55_01015 [Mariniblastus sp.]